MESLHPVMLGALIIAAAGVVSCATAPARVSTVNEQRVKLALGDCLLSAATRYDDGTSDAEKVARVIRAPCAVEEEAAQQALVSSMNLRTSGDISAAREGFAELGMELATEAVLLSRLACENRAAPYPDEP